MKTIMLVCSAGMSTSLLVSKMEKAALSKNFESKIFAVSSSEADSKINSEDPDIILLGPQVRFMLEDFKGKVKEKNIPVSVIDMRDYGVMNGEKVLNDTILLMENHS